MNTYDKLYKEVPTYKLITPSIVSERLKVRGSLAKRALEEMAGKGLIKHSDEVEATVVVETKTKGKTKGKKGKKAEAEE